MKTLAIGFTCISLAMAANQPRPMTFHKDVLPILQARCQGCHRPGEIGLMPLLTYQQARPWAKAIKEAVLSRKMPPWSADSTVAHYRNDPSLSAAEIETLTLWADAGAPEGDLKDAPPPRQFVAGWNIGQPDIVFEMPVEYAVSATGVIEYTYLIIPTHFTEDRWVQASEVRPGNRAVVHHVAVWARTPESKWLREYPLEMPFVPAPRPGTKRRSSDGDRTIEGSFADDWVAGYAPGVPPWVLPQGSAILVKAGSDLVLSLHYTTNGKAGKDRSKIGLIFAKEPPQKRAFLTSIVNHDIVIPPGDRNYHATASGMLNQDCELIKVAPHMHLRGKSMEMRVVYPTGEQDVLMRVPHYDFNWQLDYEFATPKVLPKGTRIEADAVYDNSGNNSYNPDPKVEVRWGDQSWEEMMVGFTWIAIDPTTDVNQLFVRPEKVEQKIAQAR
jgi:hypothetical protein